MGTQSCRMVDQGYTIGKCRTRMLDGAYKPACQATLRRENGKWFRVITSAHLSRPEDYYSIYQSGCNHECLKCHSWNFSQVFNGFWVSTDELAEMASTYELSVTVREPRERATMWHATDLCHHCGLCVTLGVHGEMCPHRLRPEQVILSPQGYGPSRNIISFTGGDIACHAEFYAQATEKIKSACSNNMWGLLETNGFGLTPQNLDLLASAGLDAFWLDIKAYDEDSYRRLCGTMNKWILKTPEWIVNRGFVLEILSLFIPGWVETVQLVKITQLICSVNPEIPFTILAFFPEYRLGNVRKPTLKEMTQAYLAVKEAGLKNVKLCNCHVFAKIRDDWNLLVGILGREALG